jgi:hypothetical protein
MNDTPDCMSALIVILLASVEGIWSGTAWWTTYLFDFVDMFAALLTYTYYL